MPSLYKIAYYYKNKYHLKTKIDIVKDYTVTNYKPSIDSICISREYIHQRRKEKAFIGRIKTKDINILLVFSLLHELKHAIDFTKNYDYNIQLFHNSLDLCHSKRPQEIEADNFARQELKTWL